jgi:flagellar basal body L-ring protein FlgH
LILQTDVFNKNNKRKMTKQDYTKNSAIEGVSSEVLECFYDNIVYTPFIRVEDDQDIMAMRSRKANRKTIKAAKAAKNAIKAVPTNDPMRRANKEPLDPYTLIFESKLETLRPPLKEVMSIEDPFSYLGTAQGFNRKVLRNSKAGIIQIESARSRPDAFMSPSGIQNPEDARVGLVDLPIDKVGVLWRKDPKKKKARSPWQEWGAILTGAGLLFFKNAGWVKTYIHQYEHHVKHGGTGSLCFFKPPVSAFKADYMLPTDNGVALQDTGYRRHKNAFVFFRHNNQEEVFLADNESEMNDWLCKLNCQAAFKTAHVRQRGILGGHYEGQRQRGIRRMEGTDSPGTIQTVQTPTGEVTIQSGKIDQTLAQQISAIRKESIESRLSEIEERLAASLRQLEDDLRDARHLMILAPIQQKSREQVVQGARRAQEKLLKNRIEVWRARCHRDILTMDLEEEDQEGRRRQARIDKLSGKTTDITDLDSTSVKAPNGIERLHSTSTYSDKTITARGTPTATAIHSRRESKDTGIASTVDEEEFQTPPDTPPRTPTTSTEAAAVASPFSIQSSTSPASFKLKSPPRQNNANRLSFHSVSSVSSQLQPIAPRPSFDDGPLPSPSLSDYRTPMLDDAAAEKQRGDFPGLEDDGPRPKSPATPTSTRGSEAGDRFSPHSSFSATPDRASKVRRSLQKTAELRSHTRSSSKRSGTSSRDLKDMKSIDHSAIADGSSISSSTGVIAGPTSHASAPVGTSGKLDKEILGPVETGLKREKGSFNLHGKKASVITFGSEWTAGSAEEALQRMKAAASPNSLSDPPTSHSHDGISVSAGKLPATTDDDPFVRELGTDASTTPTPGSPHTGSLDSGFKVPPRQSSLSRRGLGPRAESAASFGSRGAGDVGSIDEEKPEVRTAKEASVEA